MVRNLLAIKGNIALVGPRFFACEQSCEFFGVSAPSSHLGHLRLHMITIYRYRAGWSASWRARVERRLIGFRVRMAGSLRHRLLGQRLPISSCLRGSRCNRLNRSGARGEGAPARFSWLGLNWETCFRRSECAGDSPPNLSRAYHETLTLRGHPAVRESVEDSLRQFNSTTTSRLAWSIHF